MDYPPKFKLLWDGTLLQPGKGYDSAPYISHLNNNEVCKLLNSVEKSGFFEDKGYYNMPFAGAGGSNISVNAWKSNNSGAEGFYGAVEGYPYFDPMYCRNCPIPSEETIIGPPLANTYYLLKNYIPANRSIAQTGKLLVHFIATDGPGTPWPVKFYSIDHIFDQFPAAEQIVVLEGQPANEIVAKIKNWSTYTDSTGKNFYQVFYRPVWPSEHVDIFPEINTPVPTPASVPPDYTMSCNTKGDTYPLLPLDPNNKFWYYAPNGNWAAEVIKPNPDAAPKIRLVNKYGYSHIYSYDPALFGQTTVMAFPRYWSQDNRFFYVNILPGDYQTNTTLENSIALEQIDAANQKVKYVFIGTNSKQLFAYDLSHNGEMAAYIDQRDNPLRIVFEDLASGEQRSAIIADMNSTPVHYIAAGTIVWSTDGHTIYVAATYQENGQNKSHILSIDAINPVITNIVFSSETEVKLQYGYGQYYAGICSITADLETYCYTRIDLNTGKIDQVIIR